MVVSGLRQSGRRDALSPGEDGGVVAPGHDAPAPPDSLGDAERRVGSGIDHRVEDAGDDVGVAFGWMLRDRNRKRLDAAPLGGFHDDRAGDLRAARVDVRVAREPDVEADAGAWSVRTSA